MGRSRSLSRLSPRLAWAAGAVAPWCLAVGLVVSFPADAGQDTTLGGSFAPAASLPLARPLDLVPLATPGLSALYGSPATRNEALIRQARLAIGDSADLNAMPDEAEPRLAMKPGAGAMPKPDRTNKKDPVVGLRPTFDAKLRGGGEASRRAMLDQFLFSREFLAWDGFEERAAGDVPGPDAVARFDAADGGAGPNHGDQGASPASGPSAATLVVGATPRHLDGSTPAVPRAVALSSTTPVPAGDSVEIVALPSGAPNPGPQSTVVAQAPGRPDYATLIEQAKSPAQQKCLAEAIYFEARSESEAGQAAVAQVVLNRALSGLYPASVCGVVYQNRHRYKACQFSFACEGKSLRITDRTSWDVAVRIAKEVTEGKTYLSNVGGATHYHATYVRPGWAKRLKRNDRIGTHIFYSLKPGQT